MTNITIKKIIVHDLFLKYRTAVKKRKIERVWFMINIQSEQLYIIKITPNMDASSTNVSHGLN